MKKYKRILVAIGLHPETDLYLIKKAEKIAKDNDAELFLLHAVEHGGNYAAYEAPAGIDIEDLLMKEAINKMAKYHDIVDPSRCIIKVGAASQVILNEVEQMSADLIMLGRHKHIGLRLLLGSTINQVVHHTNVDVLAVYFLESKA